MDPAACEKIQERVDASIAKINQNAQNTLGKFDAALVRLQAYYDANADKFDEAKYQEVLAQLDQARADAAQSVATLAALSAKIDCSMPNQALAIGTMKTAAEAARQDLKEYQQQMSRTIGTLSGRN